LGLGLRGGIPQLTPGAEPVFPDPRHEPIALHEFAFQPGAESHGFELRVLIIACAYCVNACDRFTPSKR